MPGSRFGFAMESHPAPVPGADPDRPSPPGRRSLPRGFSWALGLAVVTLAVMVWVAVSTPGSDEPVARLDNAVPMPGDPPASRGGSALVGRAAPEADLTTLEGAPVSLAAYRGVPLVVNFWASWCPPCLAEMPAFEEVFTERAGTVGFLGINLREGAEVATGMARRTGVTYDLALDPDGVTAREFGVVNMPTTVFIDASGTVAQVHAGALTAAELNRRIDEVATAAASP